MSIFNFITTEKYRRGKEDEIHAANSVLALYPDTEIIEPTKYQDYAIKHIDWWFDGIPYDIKGRKSCGLLNISGNDATVLELLDADGKWGWMWGAETDFIMFKRISDWVICSRIELIDYERQTRIDDKLVKDWNLAMHKLMQRFNSKELATVVPFSDLLQLKSTTTIPLVPYIFPNND